MLKGKKKALAAQVLLGLMVAGNVYTVDCGVASAADKYTQNGDEYTLAKEEFGYWLNSVSGGNLDGYSSIMGNSGGIINLGTDTIAGKVLNVGCGGELTSGFALISGNTVTGNTVNLGVSDSKFGGTWNIFSAGATGNVVNLTGVNSWGGTVDAGSGNTLNILSLGNGSNDGTDTFKAGTINVNGNLPDNASKLVNLDASAADANGVININADNVTANEINASANGTVNVYGSGAKAETVTTKKLTINGNGSLTATTLTGVSEIIVDGSANENALTVAGGLGGARVELINAVDASSSALFVKKAVKDTSSGTSIKLNKTITGTREQSKSLVETQMASMALANGSADLVAGAGYVNAAQAVKEAKESGNAASAMVPYAAANYGSMRQESGSYVDVDSANFNIGFAKEVKNSNGTLLFGPMVEYGRGNYESHLDDGTVGTGNGQSFGVGMMARQTNDNGFYYEGSLRYGKSTSTYSSNNLVAGKLTEYTNSANYWGAHAGVGKVVKLSGDNSLDLYGKLFYTRQGASSVNVDGDTLDFSAVNSKRSRIGFRYIHGTSKVRSVYAGLAWQYEFDGAAHATANGFSTPSPSVKGSSGMLELGVLIAPKASPVSFDLGVSGWTGKQKGYSLNANMCWSF